MGLWKELRTRAEYFILSQPALRKLTSTALHSSILVNNPAYRYAYKKQMNHVVKLYLETPERIWIESTNACNSHCVYCPHKNMRRKKGFMEMQLYRKIIDECIELGIKRIVTVGIGEPLLDKLVVDKVAYAKIKGINEVAITTNGKLLSPELSRELIRAKLDRLNVSIDAATNQTYTKMRPPGKLEVVEENVRNLLKVRNQMGSTKPKVKVKFEKAPENASEVEIFKRKWKDLADRIYIGFVHNWAGVISMNSFEWHGTARREPCPPIFTQMAVQWDGKVCLCPIDYESEVVLGNIEEASIKAVWHSRELQRIRQAQFDNKFNEIPLCDRCSLRDTWWLY
jgi:radical SAM protein with 4Fe4S-binding SPASM domain